MSNNSPDAGVQRRRTPRIELDRSLFAVDLATEQSVQLLDLSRGGFRTLSPTSGLPGKRHTFRVTLPGDTHLDVQAAAVHSHRAPGHSHHFVVGWRAMDDPVSQASLQRLITFVTTVPDVEAGAVPTSAGRRESSR